MCGIVGWLDFNKNLSGEADTVKTMADKLSDRGPDESGYWLGRNIVLGHRRLTVVDPEGGRQPMQRKAGNDLYVLIYNGELYNTEDIRRDLILKGHTFEGWSDTEVLLAAYIEWGESCLGKLNGINLCLCGLGRETEPAVPGQGPDRSQTAILLQKRGILPLRVGAKSHSRASGDFAEIG